MYESILRIPDFIYLKDENEEGCIKGADSSSSSCQWKDVEISFEVVEKEKSMKVWIAAQSSPLCYVKLRFSFEKKMRGRVLYDAWERTYGDIQWQNMDGVKAMPWYFLVSERDGEACGADGVCQDASMATAGYGVKVRPGALCFWQADSQGVTLTMDVRNGGSGVLLGGRKLMAAEIVFREYRDNPFAAAQSFCSAMCTDPIFPEKPVYGSNNWYYAYGHSSQDEILADTDYLISLTEGLENRPFMVIDDCWQEHRTDEYIGGPWKKCNERFRDMKGLAAAIKEKGAKPGIWMRLLLNIDSEIPDSWRLYNQCLDPSHPDALEYIKADVDRICSWGYELIKHDFTTFDLFNRWGFQMHPYMTKDGWHFYDRSLTSAEVVIRLYEAILEASKPYGTLIIGCNTIGHLGAGLMHMHRIGDDTSGLMWERTLRMGVNTLAFRMPQHKTFFDIDADCVGVTGAIDWEKNRQWNHLLSRSGTVYFASIKPGILDEEQIREMKSSMEAASRQQDFLCVPLDWMESVYPEIWSISDEASGVQDEVEYNWYEDTGMTTVKPDDIHWLYNDRKLF